MWDQIGNCILGGKMSLFSVCFILVAICASSMEAKESCPAAEMAEDSLRKLAKASNYFALNLNRVLTAESADNVFFSPFSISLAFGMLHYGTGGETAKELRRMLGYNKANLPDDQVHLTFSYFLTDILQKLDSSAYTISSATALLVDKQAKLLPEYKADLQKLYQAYIEDTDFAEDKNITEKVNKWVKTKTRGKIESIVKSIDPSTALLLLSGAYFKGTWRTQFDKKNTKPGIFYNGGRESKSKEVDMMHLSATFRYNDDYHFQALEMPYEGKNISMLVLLPEQDDGLPELEASLTAQKLFAVRRQMYFTEVDVVLPRFKMDYFREMTEDIQELGAEKMFRPSSGFCGMTFPASGYVQILHKATIIVNEEGSEAASMTGVIITKMLPVSDATPEFVADHPFMFAIIENKSGMILFMGRVNKL